VSGDLVADTTAGTTTGGSHFAAAEATSTRRYGGGFRSHARILARPDPDFPKSDGGPTWNRWWTTTLPYQIAALLAATSWACSSLIAAEPVRRLGGPRFCRIRMLYVSAMLLVLATATGGWSTLDPSDLGLLAVSGLVGILVGDLSLFTAMARIGPRRTSVLFTSNAPMAAVGGVLLFDESFAPWALVGAVLTMGGIVLAVNFGSRSGTHSNVFERVEGSMVAGVAWAGVGALGQALGALAVKPILDDGADTLAVAAARVVIATIALWVLARPGDRLARPARRGALLPMDHLRLAASGFVAMVLGMSLLLWSLGHGDTGVATILSATTPVILLPLLWLRMRQLPTLGAWTGAALTVVGTALLL
jgi:drug/metabolite transporter (DMT)-like permease